MIERTLAALLLAAITGLVQAGETSRIQADRMVLKELEGVTVFSGHVHFTQPEQNISIRADQITILSEDKKVVRVKATGNPVKFQHSGKDKPIKGEARKLVYVAASDSITLTGDAEVQSGKDLIRGERIEYDIASQQAVASGDGTSGGRFEAVITPGEPNTENDRTK
jgi:lipopolysaccharide export system protein LptA